MTEPSPARSRRIYVLWGVAFALLLAAGLFSWLVVVPVMQVRASLKRIDDKGALYEEIAGLGGPDATVARLSRYLKLPDWIAPRKGVAVDILPVCGRSSVPVLAEVIERSVAEDLELTARALGAIDFLTVSDFAPHQTARLIGAMSTDEVKDIQQCAQRFLTWWDKEGQAKYGGEQ